MSTRQGRDLLDLVALGAPEQWLQECSSLHADRRCPHKTAVRSQVRLPLAQPAKALQVLAKVSTATLEAVWQRCGAQMANSCLIYFPLSAFMQGDAQRKDLQQQNRDSGKF